MARWIGAEGAANSTGEPVGGRCLCPCPVGPVSEGDRWRHVTLDTAHIKGHLASRLTSIEHIKHARTARRGRHCWFSGTMRGGHGVRTVSHVQLLVARVFANITRGGGVRRRRAEQGRVGVIEGPGDTRGRRCRTPDRGDIGVGNFTFGRCR